MKLRKNTKAVRSIDSAYRQWPKECYSKEPSAISIRFKKSSKLILKERVIPRPETQKLLQQILQTVRQKPKLKKKVLENSNDTKSFKYKTYRKDTRFGTSKSTSVQVCFIDNLKNNNCDFVSCLKDILFADENAATSDFKEPSGIKEPKLHHKKLRIHISQSSRPNAAMEDQERRNDGRDQLVSQSRGRDKVHQPSVSFSKDPFPTEENVQVKPQKDNKCNINMKFKNMFSGLTSFLEPLIFDPTLESEAVCLVDKQEEPDSAPIKRRRENKSKNRRKTASATTKEDYLEQENSIKINDCKDDNVDNVQYTSCLKSYGSGEERGIMKKPTRKQNDFIFPEATSSVMRAKKQEKNPCSQYQNRKGKGSKENNMKNKKGKKPSCPEEKPKKEPKKGNENKKKGPPCLEEAEIIVREKPPCQDYEEEEDDPLCQIPECKRELIEKLFEDCYEKTEGQCGLKPCCSIPPCKREQVRKLLDPTCASDITIATEKEKTRVSEFADSSDENADNNAKKIPKSQLELIQKMIEKSIEEKQSSHSQRIQISSPTPCKQSCLSTPWATTNMSMSQRTTEATPGLSRPSSESRLDHDPVPGCPRSCIKQPPPEPECVEDCPSRKKEKKSYCAQKRDEGNSKQTKKSFCAEKRGKIKPCDDDCKPAKEAGHCEDDCPDKPKKTKRVTHKVTQSEDSISTRSGRESPVYMTHTRSHRNVSTRARRESPIHSPRRSEYIEYRESESDTRRSSPSNSSRQKSTTSKTKETPAPATNKKVEKSASSDTDKERRIICSHESPLCSRCSSKVNAKESSNSEISKSNKDSSYCNLKTPCCSCSDIKSQKEELPCLKCRDRPRSAGRAKCDVKSGRDHKRYRDSDDEYEYQMMKKRKAKSKGRCTSDSDTDDSDDERFRKRQRRGRESESDRRRRKQKEEEKRQRRRKRKEEDPRRAEEERRREEEERRRREEEKSRRREEEERRRREEEKNRRREEEERRREEKIRRDEEDREKEQQRREQERIKKEEDRRRKEEERRQREIENKQKEEEEQRRREEEKRRRREIDNKRRQDEERRRQEEERRAKIEEDRRLKNEEIERKREEERLRREDEKRRREEEAERKREEQRRKAEEEKEKREEERRRREEERQRQEEERRFKEEERKEMERERKRQKEEERRRREDERREKKSRKRRRESSSGVEVCDCHRKRHCPHQSMMAAPPPPPPPPQQFGGCPSRGNFGAPGYRPPGYYYPFQTYPPTSPMQSPCPFSSNCPFPQNCPLSPIHYPSGVQSQMSIPMSGGGMCPCPVGGMGMDRMCPPMGGMGMGRMCPPMGGMGMGRMCPPMGGMGGMGRMCPMGGMGDMGGMGMGRMGGMGMGMGRMCPIGPGMGGMCPMGMGTGFGCFGTHNMVGRYYNYCYKICCKTAFCIAAVLATILIILFLI